MRGLILMHKTVLLNEAIDNLNVKEDGICVDATLGFGGHSGLILKRIKGAFFSPLIRMIWR